ncbi:1-acyl-sn-glycerol-3-phosphate acyltransferase [Methylopila sp. M107]|uniref:lysophospholipid acyltransferase family protein n=1 Tax=Methylopila sp. M107 TaxID=1101190 RepID=UPI00035F165C|nr:1-acyl-sn-glycerol-3-phosphate acyltransferase [Methylopila sp. M107]
MLRLSASAAPRRGRRVYWRVAAFNVAMVALVCIVTLVAGPFTLLLPRDRVRGVATWWCRANLWLLKTIVGIDLEVRGREHIPQGAALVAMKHQSQLETFGVMPFLPDPVFVLKRELTWLPFFGWFLIRLKMIAINRSAGSDALTQMLTQAAAAAQAGRQIVIFPEGTRREVDAPPRYKQGVVHLYERLGLPCTPVAIDTGAFWPKGRLERRQGRAVIQFLEPIPAGLKRETFQKLMIERIEGATNALIAEARGVEPTEPERNAANLRS